MKSKKNIRKKINTYARNDKKSSKPDHTRKIIIVAGIVVVLLISVLAYSSLSRRKGPSEIVGEITYEDVQESEVLLSFSLNNEVKQVEECSLALELSVDGKQVYSQEVYGGIIGDKQNANAKAGRIEKRVLVMMPTGKTATVLTPNCAKGTSAGLDFVNLVGNKAALSAACDAAVGPADRIICGVLNDKAKPEDYSKCFEGIVGESMFFCLAVVGNDYTLCNNIIGTQFYMCLANLRHDKIYCQYIEDEQAKAGCEGLVS